MEAWGVGIHTRTPQVLSEPGIARNISEVENDTTSYIYIHIYTNIHICIYIHTPQVFSEPGIARASYPRSKMTLHHTYIYIYIYIYIYTYIHAYMYIYTHTTGI
jgi:hypothetical protein